MFRKSFPNAKPFLTLCKNNDIMTAFKLLMLGDAREFLHSLSPKVRDKVLYNIARISGGEKNPELFKKLESSEIWESRTLFGGIAYRLFAFWDKDGDSLVVATHGILKKSQKTPTREIRKAEMIRKEYFKLKKV